MNFLLKKRKISCGQRFRFNEGTNERRRRQVETRMEYMYGISTKTINISFA